VAVFPLSVVTEVEGERHEHATAAGHERVERGQKGAPHRILQQNGLGNGTALFLPYDQGLEQTDIPSDYQPISPLHASVEEDDNRQDRVGCGQPRPGGRPGQPARTDSGHGATHGAAEDRGGVHMLRGEAFRSAHPGRTPPLDAAPGGARWEPTTGNDSSTRSSPT
jgi:hypothetical protein